MLKLVLIILVCFVAEVKEFEASVEKTEIKNEADVMAYYRLREQLTNLAADFQSWSVTFSLNLIFSHAHFTQLL